MSKFLEEASKPFTMADRVIGVLMGAGMIGLGVWMWVQPALILVGDEVASGRGGRKVVGWLRLIDLVWSRPLAVILFLLAAMVLWSSLMRDPVRAPGDSRVDKGS